MISTSRLVEVGRRMDKAGRILVDHASDAAVENRLLALGSAEVLLGQARALLLNRSALGLSREATAERGPAGE